MSSSDHHEGVDRLGYLLKQVYLRYIELSRAALATYGIDGRDVAVLQVLADGQRNSQQQLGHRLGVDRTTMVSLIDRLEDKGLVARRPASDDRRRNVVELTDKGRQALSAGISTSLAVEQQFLKPLSDRDAQQFRDALRILGREPTA